MHQQSLELLPTLPARSNNLQWRIAQGRRVGVLGARDRQQGTLAVEEDAKKYKAQFDVDVQYRQVRCQHHSIRWA